MLHPATLFCGALHFAPTHDNVWFLQEQAEELLKVLQSTDYAHQFAKAYRVKQRHHAFCDGSVAEHNPGAPLDLHPCLMVKEIQALSGLPGLCDADSASCPTSTAPASAAPSTPAKAVAVTSVSRAAALSTASDALESGLLNESQQLAIRALADRLPASEASSAAAPASAAAADAAAAPTASFCALAASAVCSSAACDSSGIPEAETSDVSEVGLLTLPHNNVWIDAVTLGCLLPCVSASHNFLDPAFSFCLYWFAASATRRTESSTAAGLPYLQPYLDMACEPHLRAPVFLLMQAQDRGQCLACNAMHYKATTCVLMSCSDSCEYTLCRILNLLQCPHHGKCCTCSYCSQCIAASELQHSDQKQYHSSQFVYKTHVQMNSSDLTLQNYQ